MKLHHLHSWLVVVALVTVGSRAEAQMTGENRRAAAEALFIEGRRLVAEGKTAEGCAKFAESQALDPGVGTLLNLARCYERIGRTASAWTTYREAAARAQVAGQFQREATARAEAERLAGGVPKVEISASHTAPKELTLTLDGEPWSRGFPNVALPVDPGRHELVVRAPGLTPFSTSFEATSGNVTLVRVPPLRALNKQTVVLPPPDRGEPWRTTHTFAVASAALAVTAATVGTVFALKARSTYDDSQPHCPVADQCYPRGLELREEAFDEARVATVAFGIAGAAAVSTLVLWLSRPAPDRFPWQSAGTSVRVGSRPRLEMAW